RELHGPRPLAGNDERGLDGSEVPRIGDRVEVAGVVHVVLAQASIEERHELAEPAGPLAAGELITEEPRVAVAPGSDAEQHPSTADVVEGHDVAGQDDRVAEVRRGDERPSPIRSVTM